jgi:hypothetical protein
MTTLNNHDVSPEKDLVWGCVVVNHIMNPVWFDRVWDEVRLPVREQVSDQVKHQLHETLNSR